ncbi:MAG TPA: benzoate transporter [Acidimicrobiia bacterium]|nr:benzoate transporter [Acidimicrobiia bacterium]
MILLLGGDKSGQWDEWYETAVPRADDLYDTHLEELKAEGLLD